jgi:hypothetical protein
MASAANPMSEITKDIKPQTRWSGFQDSCRIEFVGISEENQTLCMKE